MHRYDVLRQRIAFIVSCFTVETGKAYSMNAQVVVVIII